MRSVLVCFLAAFACATIPSTSTAIEDRPTVAARAGAGLVQTVPPVGSWHDSAVIVDYDFEGPGGSSDPQGWTTHDLTDTAGVTTSHFRVEDFAGLTGYAPITGSQSMWCGLRPTDPEAAGWGSAPGYGNLWVQDLVSREFLFPQFDVNVVIEYRLVHDLEPGFDHASLEYLAADDTWRELAAFTGAGSAWDAHIVRGDSLATVGSDYRVRFRFRLHSDRSFSDEDGGYDSDGGLVVDELLVRTGNRTIDSETFEGEAVGDGQSTDGDWVGTPAQPFGDFAGLVPGAEQIQEGAVFNSSSVWSFTNGSSDTYACGGFGGQPAVPLERSASAAFNERIWNEVRSPFFPIGTDREGTPIPPSRTELRLQFEAYQDLPQERNVFYTARVRFRVAGQETPWQGNDFAFFGLDPEWVRAIRAFAIPDGATEAQVALGVIDLGGADCHGHAPLFDNVCVARGFASEVVANTNDSGPASLRQAIAAANADPDTTLIRFSIGGPGPHTIQPAVALEPLTEPVVVDGFTEAGALPHADPAQFPVQTSLQVQLDGSLTSGASGLVLQGSGLVRGLAVGNFDVGIDCVAGATTVRGSFIGLDATGASWPNSIGVRIAAPGCEIGGDQPADGNLIAANGIAGLRIEAVSTVLGNRFGTGPDGVDPRPHPTDAIRVVGSAASGTVIGGTAAGEPNAILYSGFAAVNLVDDGFTDPTGVTIRGNRLLGNGIGIDLGADGVTPNDPGDADDGPNGLQNAPVVVAVDGTTIQADLSSAPNTSYVLDFYLNDSSCGPGDAWTWIGSESTSTDGSGQSSFSEALTVLPPGAWISSTATDPAGNTSELAPCVQVVNTPAGSEVTALVPDESGTLRAEVTYGEVLSAGNTFVTTLEVVPQPIPETFQVGDLLAFDISTTASFSAAEGVTVCIEYDDAELDVPESSLRLLHYDDSEPDFWADITTTHDLSANRICGFTTSLSPFALVGATATAVADPPAGPVRLALLGNAPNPFNPRTTVRFDIPHPGTEVDVAVYDLAGRRLRTLTRRFWPGGRHTVEWDGRDDTGRRVASGIYFCRMESGAFRATAKMTLLK